MINYIFNRLRYGYNKQWDILLNALIDEDKASCDAKYTCVFFKERCCYSVNRNGVLIQYEYNELNKQQRRVPSLKTVRRLQWLIKELKRIDKQRSIDYNERERKRIYGEPK